MILDIDMGNSAVKWCLRVDDQLHYGRLSGQQQSLANTLAEFIASKGYLLSAVNALRIASVCSVARNQVIEKELAAMQVVKPHWLRTQQQTAGVINGYQDFSRMGVDRWAAIVAAVAHLRQQQQPPCCCVVDAGSALTLDFVDPKAKHCGGYIVPGYTLQRDTLLGGTANVEAPNNTQANEQLLPGSNTADAVTHGIVLSMLSFIQTAVHRFEQQQGIAVKVLITGGDAPLLQRFSQLPMEYKQHLVLDGIALLA
jgi:type III pantothenate kinase